MNADRHISFLEEANNKKIQEYLVRVFQKRVGFSEDQAREVVLTLLNNFIANHIRDNGIAPDPDGPVGPSRSTGDPTDAEVEYDPKTISISDFDSDTDFSEIFSEMLKKSISDAQEEEEDDE